MNAAIQKAAKRIVELNDSLQEGEILSSKFEGEVNDIIRFGDGSHLPEYQAAFDNLRCEIWSEQPRRLFRYNDTVQRHITKLLSTQS